MRELRDLGSRVGTTSASCDVHAEPFREAEAEAVDERGLCAIGSHDAAQAEFSLRHRRGRQHDVGAVDGSEFLEDGSRTVAEAGAALPLLEGLPQHVGEEADEDVREHAVLALI
jgi:hypothetical protein